MKKKIIGIIILVAMLLIAMCLISACSTGEESPKQEGTSTATVSETATPETKPEVKPETKPETKPEPTTPEPAKSETKPETKPESTAPETKPESKPTEPPKPQTPTIDQSTCKHQWPDWKIVSNPTISEEGIKERTCLICGKTERGSIEKLEPEVTDDIGNGSITRNEFDSFVSYASGYGYILEDATDDAYTSYYLSCEGGFPFFAISGANSDCGRIYIIFYSHVGSSGEGEKRCFSIDEVYNFFDQHR